MDTTLAILSIAGAITLGAISPGPSFVMVARTAVASSRADGLAAALGMGVGGVIFAAAALLGLHVVLTAVPWLYLGLKVLGGAYLLFLGVMIWRGAHKPLAIAEDAPTRKVRRAFWLGLATQISNPKTAVVYASIFISLLPREVPLAAALILPLLIFVIEAGWYSIVALALSAPSPRAAYLRSKTWVDRAAGCAMGLLGAKLVVDATLDQVRG
jgi:threonine/homoserine/homoserine lactone efflux protein